MLGPVLLGWVMWVVRLCGGHGCWGFRKRCGRIPQGLPWYLLRHPLLCPLFLRHVSQAIVVDNPVNGVVIFVVLWSDLWVYPRSSDLFVACELVDGESNVGCGILAGCGHLGFGVHVV